MILFLHPPDSENGLDSKVLLEELLAPGGIYHAQLGAGGRKSLLLFTQQARAEEFAQAHANMVSGLCGLRLWASRGAQRFVGSTAQILWYSMR
jgi:hypothetical protein